jgi:hypothetical protein
MVLPMPARIACTITPFQIVPANQESLQFTPTNEKPLGSIY